jgi:hypothetical protein
MAVELNHTIVHARDKALSASFYAEILGLPAPEPLFHFLVIRCANGVSLDFMETREDIQPQHYAFLVSEAEFDEIFARVTQREVTYSASQVPSISVSPTPSPSSSTSLLPSSFQIALASDST